MPDDDQWIQFITDKGDARLRLDQILVRRLASVSRLSRSMAQRWIESGAVSVQGSSAPRASTHVGEGTRVAVRLPAEAPRRTRPAIEHRPLAVLFEDDDLLVLQKPAGVVVHPSYRQTAGTLLNAVLGHLQGRADVQPGILTRLDKDTSGIVVIALRPEMHAALQRESAAGRVAKTYLAIVEGRPRPPSGRVTLPLAHDPLDRRRIVATEGGAASETRYAVVSSWTTGEGDADTTPNSGGRWRSLVQCQLVTGRTHQIRVHLSASGWPIVGDRLYGTADPDITRQALHAWRVSLHHPVTGHTLEIEAPLPDDMQRLVPASEP